MKLPVQLLLTPLPLGAGSCPECWCIDFCFVVLPTQTSVPFHLC